MPKYHPLPYILTNKCLGEPADNAAQFVSWLESLPANGVDGLLKGVDYAVFGCGNREWARTYQRIPTLCDEVLEKNGATRIIDRGEGDASTASFFQDFDEWEAKLWQKLGEVSINLCTLIPIILTLIVPTEIWRANIDNAVPLCLNQRI